MKNQFNVRKGDQYAILNGQEGLHTIEEELFGFLIDNHCTANIIDNLFEQPEKIAALKFLNPKTIVLSTTGLHHEKLQFCYELFKELEWLPDNVVFTGGEDNFLGMARTLKEIKPAMKFYNVYTLGRNSALFQELNYI